MNMETPTRQLRVPLVPSVSRLAIDVGNVISQRDTDDYAAVSGDLADRQAQGQATKECAESCRLLVQLFGKENTFILSKCRNRVQLATWKFLNNPVIGDHGDNEPRSFLEISGILPRNILFCRERHGGSAPVRLVPLLDGQRNGPRTASGPVGKGAVAATFGLTHLIDDRADCLLSFFWEGHVWNELEKSAQQAMKKNKKKKKKKKATKRTGEEILRDPPTCFSLIQFGPLVEAPSADRTESFAISAGREASVLGSSSCSERWITCQDWEQVRQAFGLQIASQKR